MQAGEYEIETFDTTPFETAGIDVKIFHYADSIRDYMVAADLIVGHAGNLNAIQPFPIVRPLKLYDPND